jgi:hypothetical protein
MEIDWGMVITVWLGVNVIMFVGFMAFGGRGQPC